MNRLTAVIIAALLCLGAAPFYGPAPRPDCVLHQAEAWIGIDPGESVAYEYDLTGCRPSEATGWGLFYGAIDTRNGAETIRATHGIGLNVTDTATGEIRGSTTGLVAIPLSATRYTGRVTNAGRKAVTVRVTWLVPSYLGS